MIHPSYTDLMNVVNSNVEAGEEPVVSSRYSIVLATAKRARQIIDGAEALVEPPCDRALSIAVEEVYKGKVKILTGDEESELEDVTEGADEVFGEDFDLTENTEAETADSEAVEE